MIGKTGCAALSNAMSPRLLSALLTVATIAIIVSAMGAPAGAFRPPDKKARTEAIGDVNKLAPPLRRALGPDSAFPPMTPPGPADWLAQHSEKGQTFEKFLTDKKRRPEKKRKKIYFQPLGPFPPDKSPSLESLKTYARAFFAMEVEVLPAVHLAALKLTTRIHPSTGKRQILTGDVLQELRRRLPDDAFCILAITMTDLYPEPDWNFVFGQASLRGRVGVYSFARYDPAFHGERRNKEYKTVLLKRSCKVLVHETAHMFGMEHCIYYSCAINGSNHLDESDSRPMHLCPVCMRKLQHSIEFDVVERYKNLQNYYDASRFDDASKWVKERLEHIQASDS